MISPPSTTALISPPPTRPIRQVNKHLLVFSTPSTTTSSSKRMIPLRKFSSTLLCFPRRRRVNPIPSSSLGNYGIIMMSSRRVVPIPARDRVIDFGKYKGKMLGSLPSSYLKWVTKNLRAGDSVEWANLADEVLSDPIYRDRIEWELAEKVLNGESSSAGHNNSSWEGGAVSELLEISERFGWDNEDKGGWSKIDFGVLGTSKGGRIPRRRQQQQLRGGDDDEVGGGGMKKTRKGEEVISEEDKRGRGGRNERRERMRMRRQRRGEEESGSTSSSGTGGTRRSMRIRMQEEMVGGYGNRKEVEISNKGGQSESVKKKKKKVNNDEDEEGDHRGNGDGGAAVVGTGTGTGTGRSPFPGREALFNKLLNRQR
ncbi:hypothetical protein BUALT_Bualt07G0176400 [Buddleja alternifolia]|uniref:Uncharacterized protein n=1 Tax=Buddleja alternifolia TaxID=168488 RepID=A0AAV6XM73_9LAMI|nr:hypothetical protein BUALT_Bualt07G0176400 [Buddleja alternifolia]